MSRRQQESSVGELLRQDADPSAARGCHRPPRTPVGDQLPRVAAPAPARPPLGRRAWAAGEEFARVDAVTSRACGSRSASPAPAASPRDRRLGSPTPAVELERPPRIVGAFRAVKPRSQSAQNEPSRGRSPSVGSNTPRERASSAGRGGRDFVAANRVAAAQRPRASSAGRAPPQDVKFARNGKNVPVYLQRVKADLADEERVVAQHLGIGRNADGAPPGHRVLSEDERREVMAGLQRRKSDLDAKHSRLPLRVETQAQKQRAQDLEKACREVDENIVKFSRHNVLVKL